MEIDFSRIDYLAHGNPRQQKAWQTLTAHRIMELLAPFDPLLAGTIPIGIDIEGSDLDIICCYRDREGFTTLLHRCFAAYEGFRCDARGASVVVASFRAGEFEIEIYGDILPSRQQNGWRHMLVEHRLLQEHGDEFRRQVIALKRQGVKTEPAFAKLLGLEGDPYEALLRR